MDVTTVSANRTEGADDAALCPKDIAGSSLGLGRFKFSTKSAIVDFDGKVKGNRRRSAESWRASRHWVRNSMSPPGPSDGVSDLSLQLVERDRL